MSVKKMYEVPDATAPTNYSRDIYSGFRNPIFTTDSQEWENLARKKVPAANFGYVFGSASTAKTYKANLSAFDNYRLRPRMLRNVTIRDLSVVLFGRRYPSPILASPIGVQSIMHADAEEATARACNKLNIPMILSTAATRTIEQVAQANGNGDRWFQLYWPKPSDDDITASLLKRAKDNGYTVLVVTLDTFVLGWRPTDLDTAYLPFLWGEGCQIGHSDPVFNARYDAEVANDARSSSEKLTEALDILRRPGTLYGALKVMRNASILRRSRAWLDVLNSGTYREWSHLKILRDLWDGPIVLKGIQTVEDAHRAIEYGIEGISVSNHGGRQLDGAIASLDALAEITADEKVKQSGLTVLFDSGVRTGSDVLKAMALGAKAVLIGRPYVYGLAIAGEAGVKHVLKCILADADNSLANLGHNSVQQLSREDLQIRRDAKI